MYHFITGLYRPVFYLISLFILAYFLLNEANAEDIKKTLRINQNLIHVEIADTDALRSKGLMHRTKLDKNSGMLFIFDNANYVCFWMKNTPLPLSIAFIDEHFRITNITDMHPFDLSTHCPTKPIVYALEMEQGWFDKHQIKAGDLIHF